MLYENMRNQNSKIKSFKARDFEVAYMQNKSYADRNERFDKYLADVTKVLHQIY
jgi:hypothetical protein